MRLSNTMIMNEKLLPNTKKAFTLAEVLITLSILGVVAALTIPSLVNRQNELAAITKMKKAISTYESVAEVYMAENEATRFDVACANLGQYFKQVEGAGQCAFTTADGVRWIFGNSDGNGTPANASRGNAVIFDSKTSPRYGVVLWTKAGLVNSKQSGMYGNATPVAANFSDLVTGTNVPSKPAANAQPAAINGVTYPTHGYRDAASMLNISKSQNQGAEAGSETVNAAAGIQ